MKASELRIGNLVLNNNVQIEFSLSDWDNIANRIFSCTPIDNYKPIPLSEEWLIKLGWYQDVDKNGQIEYIKPVCNYYIKHAIQYFAEYQFRIIAQFKYVHQLQNLHFALTGEELKLQS